MRLSPESRHGEARDHPSRGLARLRVVAANPGPNAGGSQPGRPDKTIARHRGDSAYWLSVKSIQKHENH
jgi:hypothetical protein